jgi:hypothetical protein
MSYVDYSTQAEAPVQEKQRPLSSLIPDWQGVASIPKQHQDDTEDESVSSSPHRHSLANELALNPDLIPGVEKKS